MENETQDILINLINTRLDKFEEKNDKAHKEILDSCITKRDVDRIIESNNRRIGMLADTDKEARVDLDNHCIRIRELEKQQAVETYKLAAVISGAVFIIYFAINSAWDFLKDKIK